MLGTIMGFIMLLIAYDFGTAPPVLTEYNLFFKDLPDSLENKTAVLIADTHVGGSVGVEWLNERVDQIMAQKPDMIFIAGDVFEQDAELDSDPVVPLKRLHAPLGVWAVTGNHEFYDPEFRSIKYMEKAGLGLLRNRCVELAPGVSLAGVDDLSIYKMRGGGETVLSDTMSTCSSPFLIMLSHSPLDCEEVADLGGNLMISGHTHGGQVWPFDYVVRAIYPHLEGKFDIKNMKLIVTRGAATAGPPLRLFQPGEIVKLVFRKSAQD